LLYFCRAQGCPCVSESPGECGECGGNHEAIMRLEVMNWILNAKTERGQRNRRARVGEWWAQPEPGKFPRMRL
jgi:hypothetical protein